MKPLAVSPSDAVTATAPEPEPRPSLIEWIVTAGFVVVGIVVLMDTADLEFQSQFGPGPRFFSVLLAVPLVLVAAVRLIGMLAAGWRARYRQPVLWQGHTNEPRATLSEHLRFVLLLVSMLAYALLLEAFGFELTTLCLMLTTLIILGRKPRTALIEASIATVLLYSLFKIFLGVQLPAVQWPFAPWLGV